MSIGQRILAGIVGTTFIVAFIMLAGGVGLDKATCVFGLVFGAAAAISWWIALRGHRPENRVILKSVTIGGFVLGAIAFLVGFLWPIVFGPRVYGGEDFRPLIGVFVTGPLGVIVGATLGWIIGFVLRWQASQVCETDHDA